jgi:1-acyl-sn-glycerol-3-phosphate acyltransferase
VNTITLPTRRTSALLALARLLGFLGFSLPVVSFGAALNALGLDSTRLRRWYFGHCGRILGLKVIVRGRQSDARPKLVVANHISYFDIFVLGGTVHGAFVGKSEIASWPLFGLLSKVAQVVFIDRRRTATHHARDRIRKRMERGHSLILFPESTSNDGNHVRPFKSALFTVAEQSMGNGKAITVQPVSVAYTRVNGMPMGIGWRPFVAWYGDMDLMPHLWQALRLGRVTVEVTFHEPVNSAAFADRKALARHCHRVTHHGVARLLTGRHAA